MFIKGLASNGWPFSVLVREYRVTPAWIPTFSLKTGSKNGKEI